MDPETEDWTPVLDRLTELRRCWPGAPWTWDGRFTMLASSFTKDLELAARTCLAPAFPYAWDATTLPGAPAGLRAICERAGGLRAGQLLMAGKTGGIVLTGLWWPWGGGEQITLRLGLGACEAMEEPFPQVRMLFGVR